MKIWDHFWHLINLYELYLLLEKIVSDKKFPFKLPRNLHFLLKRSEAIKEDIDFLTTHPQIKEILSYHKVGLLPTTQKYIDSIEKMKNNKRVFIHFLMRILGDCYGGKFMGNYTMRLYQKNQIYTEHKRYLQDLPGLKFYILPSGTLKKLLEALKPIRISEKIVLQEAADSYDAHFDIFNEMEKNRSEYVGTWHVITKFSTIFMSYVWNSETKPQVQNDCSDNHGQEATGDSFSFNAT